MKTLSAVTLALVVGAVGGMTNGATAAPITYDFTGPTSGTNVDLGSRTPTRPRAAPASPARRGPIRVPRPPTTARSIPHPVFIWSETIAAVMSRVSVSAARQAAAAAGVPLPGPRARVTGTDRG